MMDFTTWCFATHATLEHFSSDYNLRNDQSPGKIAPIYILQKQIGCFNHRVVTLVADLVSEMVIRGSLRQTA